MELLKLPRHRFVIQMPTGSGKTRTTMEIISNVLKESPPGTIVVWLAHSRELCEQAFQCFVEVWQHLSNKPLVAARYWGSHAQPPSFDNSMFIVGGFQKIHAALRRDDKAVEWISKRAALVVVDEAHKAVAPTYKKALMALKGIDTRIIGLTATPGRSDIDEIEEMTTLFFEHKVNIKTPDGASELKMLKDRKVLAKIDCVSVSGVKVELTAYQKKRLEQSFDLPEGVLKKVGSNNVRNIEIMKKLLQSCREFGRRVLFFSCSVKHSRFITSLLLYHGISSAHVDGSTSKPRRNQVIEDFKDGNIRVLCNYGVLTTGFDAPNTDEVFISRPTKSVILYSQMIGRGLRGTRIGGTERCRIVNVKDTILGTDMDYVYEYFDGYWDN